jgi:outer membrane protein, heavy metal efflux system
MHKIMCVIVLVLFGLITSRIEAQIKVNEQLTIENAVNIAIKNNPELKRLVKSVEANKAIKLQSGLISNPEFGLEVENIFGNKDFNGFSGSEITASLSQNILLAGKISKLENVAKMDILLAEWDYESKRLEVIADIRKAFTNALVTQKLIDKNNELLKTSESFITNLKNRALAGKISPAEVSRSEIILNSVKIDLNKLQNEYDSAIFELTSLINDPSINIGSLKGELQNNTKLPDFDSLYSKLSNNPNLKRYESEYSKQKAVITFEESKATPDLTVSLGFKRLFEVDANTFVLGVSMPIPVFDRNQGSIKEAEIRLDEKIKENEIVINRFSLQLNLLYKRYEMLMRILNTLQNESIPNAEESFKIIMEGNLVGRFTILDVIDVQRTLFEIQNQYLNTLGEIHKVVIEIECLTVYKIN